MSWWSLGGMNPKQKDFLEEHPDKTMLGMAWAYYWRVLLFFLVIEIIVIVVFIILGALFSHL